MKKSSKKIKAIFVMLLLVITIACKKERKKINRVNNILKAAQNLEKDTKKLTNLEPVTKEQLKNWMPKNLNDLKRTAYNISKQGGASSVKLTYKDENNKNVQITIIDGAGAGASYVSMFTMFTQVEIDKETETGYERTTTYDSQKVLVKYNKSGNYESSNITCLINERFGVEARGKNMNPKELWHYIKKLKIKKLK